MADLNKEEILCPKDVAQLLSVSVQSINHLARSGKLPAFRIGKLWRFRRSELNDVLTSRSELNASVGQLARKLQR
jgi:excisionase family DNA binding protein